MLAAFSAPDQAGKKRKETRLLSEILLYEECARLSLLPTVK